MVCPKVAIFTEPGLLSSWEIVMNYLTIAAQRTEMWKRALSLLQDEIRRLLEPLRNVNIIMEIASRGLSAGCSMLLTNPSCPSNLGSEAGGRTEQRRSVPRWWESHKFAAK